MIVFVYSLSASLLSEIAPVESATILPVCVPALKLPILVSSTATYQFGSN